MSRNIVELNEQDVFAHWPFPGQTVDKYSRGVVGLATGSKRYPGAAILGVTGALYSGAGMIRYLGEVNPELILVKLPSVTIGPGRVESLVAGSGWDGHRVEQLAELVDRDVPMVLDAGALELLPDLGQDLPNNSLLTPHAGELARLLNVERSEVEAEPIEHAMAAAEQHGCCVLLKGARQFCVAPDGNVLTAVPGLTWTGQAGSGDVLAGICGTLLAAGAPALWAGALAASIQALAALRKPGPFPPDVMAESVAEILGDHTQ